MEVDGRQKSRGSKITRCQESENERFIWCRVRKCKQLFGAEGEIKEIFSNQWFNMNLM